MTKQRSQAKATFKIGRMNEPGRSQRLRLVMSRVHGVSKVDINYILDTVTVTYDADSLKLDQVRKKVERSAIGKQ